jgi:hypothetical protein
VLGDLNPMNDLSARWIPHLLPQTPEVAHFFVVVAMSLPSLICLSSLFCQIMGHSLFLTSCIEISFHKILLESTWELLSPPFHLSCSPYA